MVDSRLIVGMLTAVVFLVYGVIGVIFPHKMRHFVIERDKRWNIEHLNFGAGFVRSKWYVPVLRVTGFMALLVAFVIVVLLSSFSG